MRIREKVEKSSGTVTLVAVAIIGIAIAAATRATSPRDSTGVPDKTTYYFLDPESGHLSLEPSPISPATRNGRETYRAHVYSCTSCADASTRFVGYIEKLSPGRAAKEAQMRSGMLPGEQLRPAARAELQAMRGQFISSPSPVAWIDSADPAVEKLMASVRARCPGLVLPCLPGPDAHPAP